MIKKVLIANRGEIAVRVMRACKELDIKTVAVFSEADRNSFHVQYADEAYCIGPAPSNESYLVADHIIEAAKKSKADAIHPGYGFLSENADFSDRCKKENIIFIGPTSHVINTMGDKITARLTMVAAGVPVVPGISEDLPEAELIQRIRDEINYPVMIKASAGGGGKGMRLVREDSELEGAIRSAKSEAASSFANDVVYVEKYIESPHHVEFQVLGDSHGNVIHLCERECSVQRRHQKVIEETPSPLMTPEVREAMGKIAVKAAAAINYEGAGTIEFLMDDDLNFYFLEMNTRLQVEHPVTEAVVGVDLVKEQIRVADGGKLSVAQNDIIQRGHAIECRIYAEDADNNFMPSPGKIIDIKEPSGPGIRVDGYAYAGYDIPIYYDPMISKLIVWAETREKAILRMVRALDEYQITGPKNSINYLKRILLTKDFMTGKYNTHFIEKNTEELKPKDVNLETEEELAMIAVFLRFLSDSKEAKPKDENNSSSSSPWKDYGRMQAITKF